MTDGAGTQTSSYDDADRLTGVTRGAANLTYGYDQALIEEFQRPTTRAATACAGSSATPSWWSLMTTTSIRS
jgi:hypothetical protein